MNQPSIFGGYVSIQGPRELNIYIYNIMTSQQKCLMTHQIARRVVWVFKLGSCRHLPLPVDWEKERLYIQIRLMHEKNAFRAAKDLNISDNVTISAIRFHC